MTEQTQRSFHAEIDSVRDQIVEFAVYVTEAVSLSTQALLDGNLAQVQSIIDGDDALDDIAVSIEEQCQKLLALHQPVASDLRQILSALWITAELERDGDLACNICKGTRRLFGSDLTQRLRELITDMSEEAVRLTRLGVDAYADADSGLAAALDDIDDRLDNLHNTFVQTIIEAGINSALETQVAVQLALIGRYYERIGDHAVNIGERVRYMTDAWKPKRAGAAQERERKRLRALSTDDLDELSDNGTDN